MELNAAFELLAHHLLDGEAEYISELEKKQEQEEYTQLEHRIEYLEKFELESTKDLSSSLPALITSREYIMEDLSMETHYWYDFSALSLKGVRNNKLYLECSSDFMQTMNNTVIRRLVEHVFKNQGFGETEIVTEDTKLEKVSLENNHPMWELIQKVLLDSFSDCDVLFDLQMATVRTYQDGKLFLDYDGDELGELRNRCKYSMTGNKDLLSSTLFALIGENIEMMFVNSSPNQTVYTLI
ncbi:hypothetical protein SOP94_17165 [Peribacillus frigoritolerans]|uniref:hypothetical protein n=1 Tax=Peribacillus frigoritolerans TaxID=450367 RepID=UPI002B24C16A|nr:hypothetical protein [Peribacillus frigoritolerans]MEB2630188.1 hypothetical protein [Peribacillus frigoritolerans]